MITHTVFFFRNGVQPLGTDGTAYYRYKRLSTVSKWATIRLKANGCDSYIIKQGKH